MNCPSCGRGLPGGPNNSCPFCGAVLAPALEGSLAPELRAVTPPARGKVEPMREIPGLNKRKERTWKDDVRDRLRDRKEKRGEGELPLFRESEEPAVPPAPSSPPDLDEPAAEAGGETDPPRMTLGEPDDLGPEAMVDLPLRGGRVSSALDDEADLDREVEDDTPAEWSSGSARPVERPAQGFERLQAAVLDLVFLGGLWALVLYFAGRASGAGTAGLLGSWPYLATYLGGLGLLYAAFFTGSTGQTPGKMVTGLRVIDRDGLPPGFARALLRAALGMVGTLALGAGWLSLFFDPARRAFHDRLFHTRVVKG